MNHKKEITIEDLKTDDNWAQVFADESDGNVDKTIHAAPGSNVSLATFTRNDVVEIIAAVNGENEGDDWVGVFRLWDGRFVTAEGGCDYTGWDCRAHNNLFVASTFRELMQFGLTDQQKARLGLSTPSIMTE